jgi:hypothetical protein
MFTSAIQSIWHVVDLLQAYNGAVTAVATIAIGIFTYALVRVTNRQARLTRESIDLARQEFIATHRPRIIVRFIQGPFYDDDGHQSAWVTAANIGDSPGDIEEFGGDLARRKDNLWITPGVDGSPKRIEPITLASGQRHVFTVRSKNPHSDTEILADALDVEETCLVGVIRYRDENDVLRETGYFRILDQGSDTFVRSKNDEDEYSD